MAELSKASDANSGRNLPVCLGPQPQRRRLHAVRVQSDFASQLIAARDRMPVQREKRRASEGVALSVYGSSARLDEKRMPKGFRLSVSA